MARSKEELTKLLEDFRGWYQQDFGQDYNKEVLIKAMKELVHERLGKFLYRRIGHLPDADFALFLDLFVDDKKIEAPSAPAVPNYAKISIDKEALEASKLEPEGFVKAHQKKKK